MVVICFMLNFQLLIQDEYSVAAPQPLAVVQGYAGLLHNQSRVVTEQLYSCRTMPPPGA